jgi:hypothetical protein
VILAPPRRSAFPDRRSQTGARAGWGRSTREPGLVHRADGVRPGLGRPADDGRLADDGERDGIRRSGRCAALTVPTDDLGSRAGTTVPAHPAR